MTRAFRDADADRLERDDVQDAPEEEARAPGRRVRVGREWIWWLPARSPGKVTRTMQGAAQAREQRLAALLDRPGGLLPHKSRLEAVLGTSLDIEAHHDAHTAAVLDELGAVAAQRGRNIAFAEANPELETVAHEVAHVLQSRGGAGHGIAAEGSRAEVEADAFAAAVTRGTVAPLSPSPSAAHLLRVKQVRRGPKIIWRRAEEDDEDALDTATMSEAQLAALLGDLLAEGQRGLAMEVLREANPTTLRSIVKKPPPDTSEAVLSYLRVQLDPRTSQMSWWNFALRLTREQDDGVRELLIISQCGTDVGALKTVWKNLKTQANDLEERSPEWCDNVAIREFIKQITESTPIPQHGIAWFRSSMLDGDWVATEDEHGKHTKRRGIGTLSLHGLLVVVKDHFRAMSRAARAKKKLTEAPLVSEQGEDLDNLLGRVELRIVDLVSTGDIASAALCVSMLHEMTFTGQEGGEWSESVLIRLAPVLIDRIGDSTDPTFGGALTDVLRIVHAYGELARRDPQARRLVEYFAPRVNSGLSTEDVQKKDFRFDRYLSGTLLGMSHLKVSEVDVYRAFVLVEPHVLELLETREQDEERKPRIVPESVANLLQAFARLLGGTEFDNLPEKVQELIQAVVAYAAKFVPEESVTKRRNPHFFSATELINLAAALIELRNPPEDVVAFLGTIAGPTSEAIDGERVRFADLETLLHGFQNLFGDVIALLPIYEAVLAKLTKLVEGSEAPSPSLVRLVILAYNQRDILERQAIWYEREVKRREGLDKGHKRNPDPFIAKGTRAHGQLTKRAVTAATEIEGLFDVLLAKTTTALPKYEPNQQRRILFELTKVRGLSVSRVSEEDDEDESPENRRSQGVAGVFHSLSKSRAMLGGPLGDLDCHTVACLVYDYGWLRDRDEEDATLLRDLLDELRGRAQAMTPLDLTGVLGVLAKLRRPTQEIVQYLEELTIVAATMIRARLGELDPTFFARTLSAYRELSSTVVVRFIELVETVVMNQLDRHKQIALADLLYLTETFVRFDDDDRDEAFERGESENDQLKFRIIAELRKRLEVSLDKQKDEDKIYDRAKARIARRTLPWRGYDQQLGKMYPIDEKGRKRVEEARKTSEKTFSGEGVEPLERNGDTRYEVNTISPEGELVSTEVQDNIIFRELTAHEFDFVYVQLPERAHVDKFKGVVSFRGKTYRYDVYGGSSLKGDKDKKKDDSEKHIKALGIELEAVEFFRKFFNYQEGFFYAQRALFPNEARESLGLKGGMRGLIAADAKRLQMFKDLPFGPNDGWGFIKKSLIGMSLDKHRDKDRRLEATPRSGNMSYQALQWYSQKGETVGEAIEHGKGVLDEGEQDDPNTTYRALTTGRPTVRTAVAMPVLGEQVVLPSDTKNYEQAPGGLLLGRAPFDNPNLYPVPSENVLYNPQGPPEEKRPKVGQKNDTGSKKDEKKSTRRKKKTKEPVKKKEPETEQPLDPSQFMSTMESIQYTMTGYISMSQKDTPRLAFFKGMMGVIDDDIWPLEGTDFVVSNQDIKLDESWEEVGEKVRLEEHTAFNFNGLLVVKDWNAPERHVGVPLKMQKWLAGDFDGDPEAIIFKDEVPELWDQVEEEFREQGVSGKLDKTFTPSGEVLTRGRQIADIRSKVLGTWSTISDRVLSESPENRELLARALVDGNLTFSDDELTDLICAYPEKQQGFVARLDQHDRLLLEKPGEWQSGASIQEITELKKLLGSVETIEDRKPLLQLIAWLAAGRAWQELKSDPKDEKGFKAKKAAVKQWLGGTGASTRAIIKDLYAVELLDMEIQTGIKVGTDGYKTKAATRKYEARAREVLKTANKLQIANKAVPYGKSLLRKMESLGSPDLSKEEWKTIYFRCRELYGIPARTLQGMIEAVTGVDPSDYDGEYDKWREGRTKGPSDEKSETEEKPEGKPDPKIEQLERIFTEIYLKMSGVEIGEDDHEEEPQDKKDVKKKGPEKDEKGKEPERDKKKLEGKKEGKKERKKEKEPEEPSGQPVSGLPNRGNTCYVSGALHLIAANPNFRQAFEHPRGLLGDHAIMLCNNVTVVLRKIDSGTKVTNDDVDDVLDALQLARCLEVDVNAQQDTAELLQAMLDAVRAAPSVDISRERTLPVSDGSHSQPNHMLQLDGIASGEKSFRSMDDLLDNSHLETQYDDQRHLSELHMQWFTVMPDTLTIHLKRTVVDVKQRQTKMLEKLAGPLVLTVPTRMAPDDQAHVYRLTCFVHHVNYFRPTSPRGGHFVSYVLRGGTWYQCDDSRVRAVPAEFAEAVAMSAYLFVYQKANDVGPILEILGNFGHFDDVDDEPKDKEPKDKEQDDGSKGEEVPDTTALEALLVEIARKNSFTGLKNCRKNLGLFLGGSAPESQKTTALGAFVKRAIDVGTDVDTLEKYLTTLDLSRELLDTALLAVPIKDEPKIDSEPKPTKSEEPPVKSKRQEKLLRDAPKVNSKKVLETFCGELAKEALPDEVAASLLGAAFITMLKAYAKPDVAALAIAEVLAKTTLSVDVLDLALFAACKGLLGATPDDRKRGEYFYAFWTLADARGLDSITLAEIGKKYGISVRM